MRNLYFEFKLRPIENGWILIVDYPGLRDKEYFSETIEPLLEIIKKEESEYGGNK